MLGIAAIAIVLGLRFFEVIGTFAAWGLVLAIIAVAVIRSAASYEPKPDDQPDQSNDLFQDANDGEWMAVRAHLKLAYQDADGVLTDREVVVNKYCWDGDGYIEAFCKLRKGSRTFRIDRIKEAIDLDTGDVLTLSRMKSWLRKRKV